MSKIMNRNDGIMVVENSPHYLCYHTYHYEQWHRQQPGRWVTKATYLLQNNGHYFGTLIVHNATLSQCRLSRWIYLMSRLWQYHGCRELKNLYLIKLLFYSVFKLILIIDVPYNKLWSVLLPMPFAFNNDIRVVVKFYFIKFDGIWDPDINTH